MLSVFLLLCKGIMLICSVFHPLISLFIHAGLTAVWAVAIHNQAGPDMSDPAHPQPGAPWYITKSCGPPVSPNLIGYCKQAKAAFAVTVLAWFVQLRQIFESPATDIYTAPYSSHMSSSPSSPSFLPKNGVLATARRSRIVKETSNRGKCSKRLVPLVRLAG